MFEFVGRFLDKKAPSKNWGMLLIVACTRYSLVKGERIVRSVLTTQLLEFESFS